MSSAPPSVQTVTSRLAQQRPDIERALARDVATAVRPCAQLTQLCPRQTALSPEARFRKGLLQCALAKGFSDWQQQMCGASRLQQLQADPSARADNQNRAWDANGTTLRDYLHTANVPYDDHLSRTVLIGQKLLVVEHLTINRGLAYTPLLFFCEPQYTDLKTAISKLWSPSWTVFRGRYYELAKSQDPPLACLLGSPVARGLANPDTSWQPGLSARNTSGQLPTTIDVVPLRPARLDAPDLSLTQLSAAQFLLSPFHYAFFWEEGGHLLTDPLTETRM
ncbi:hypothetical protein LTR56_026755 [Elasticomyces elasticus]|nr:hypothetical protein LTR22_027990 [Elasticomyces elasticus]KAK3615182.1 hypothetical protein LTR56_026755 [Elasticomyces elasticus]